MATALCTDCETYVALRKDRSLRKHGDCPGAGRVIPLIAPIESLLSAKVGDLQSPDWQALASDAAKRHMEQLLGADPGPTRIPPVISAAFDGTCSTCGADILVGDGIRASLEDPGTWECEEHNDPWKEDDDVVAGFTSDHVIASWIVPAMAADPIPDYAITSKVADVPAPDAFADPTPPQRKLNVSGQPDADRDHLGRYLVQDPATGDYRRAKNGNPQGVTRVTTFVKAAQDTTSLNKWGKRNVLIGASRRPDLVAKAHGMTHEESRDALDRLVGELDTAAGGKVAADIGTQLHEFTERMDAGLAVPEDAPEMFQDSLRLYRDRLAAAGFEAVPGLIERTTMISEWGGVCGTLDRIMYHRPSGTYVVVDLKTGKGLQDYGLDETYAQEWMYAHGVNQHGIYDWNTKTWGRPDTPERLPMLVKVREDVGLIVHMPVQGDQAGQLFLLRADLARGREYAELCASNRGWKKSKAVEWAWEPDRPTEPVSWGARFAAVTSAEEARALWDEADASGVSDADLASLVAIARTALADKG